MNLNDVFVNVEVLKLLAQVFAMLVLGGLSVLAIKYGFAKPLAQARDYLKSHQATIIAQIDEPTDPFIVKLSKETGISVDVLVKLLPEVFKAFVAGMSAIPLGEPQPEVGPLPPVETPST